MNVKIQNIATSSAQVTVSRVANIGCIEIFQRVAYAQRPIGLWERRFAPLIKNV